jgi:hypothetical protein
MNYTQFSGLCEKWGLRVNQISFESGDVHYDVYYVELAIRSDCLFTLLSFDIDRLKTLNAKTLRDVLCLELNNWIAEIGRWLPEDHERYNTSAQTRWNIPNKFREIYDRL